MEDSTASLFTISLQLNNRVTFDLEGRLYSPIPHHLN